MKKAIIILFILLASIFFVNAENALFSKPDFFFSSPFEKLMVAFEEEPQPVEDKALIPKTITIKLAELEIEAVEILITEDKLVIGDVVVKVNQPVVWKNKQQRVPALIYGVRETSEMRSGLIKPGESFTWKFSSPGEYTYVDGVVIGRVGKVIVNP